MEQLAQQGQGQQGQPDPPQCPECPEPELGREAPALQLQPLKDLQCLSSFQLPSLPCGHQTREFQDCFFTGCSFMEGFYKHINPPKPMSCSGHCPEEAFAGP